MSPGLPVGAALLLAGCAPHVVTSGLAPRDLRRDGVDLAPVVLVADLPAPPLPPPAPPGLIEQGMELPDLPDPTVLDPVAHGPFLRNDFVGNIRFGGGFVRTGAVAFEVRSRLIELNEEDPYRVQGSRWLSDTLTSLLADRGVPYRALPTFDAPAPEHVPLRGLHPEDGRDNVNIPRTTLRPVPRVGGEGLVLVPYLRSYYTHTGGWFLGQQFGCLGGARVDVLVVLYDGSTPAWWMEATGRRLGNEGSPSRAALDQYLLDAESEVAAQLARGLLR